jgi:hypothetical protein
MDFSLTLLIACTTLYIYCAGGCWLLQIVCYPTYHLVAERDFVPFHVAFGNRLIPIFVVPAVLACLSSFVLLFAHPIAVGTWLPTMVALFSVIILATTIFIEVPKHQALDKEGKSSAIIDELVRNNLPRAMSWTVGSFLLLYMMSLAVR